LIIQSPVERSLVGEQRAAQGAKPIRAKMELVIRDQQGNILSQLDPYWMEPRSLSVDDIEGALEN